MIIALFVAIIGIIPIVLSISVIKIYNRSEVAYALFLYMLFISIWQLDVAVLYASDIFSEEQITWLFKILRMGPTFMVPIVFYLAYVLLQKHTLNIKNKAIYRMLISLFNKKILFALIIWSTFIYGINMTDYGIVGVQRIAIQGIGDVYYSPQYGPIHLLYIFHTFSFLLFIMLLFFISRQIENIYLKDFLSTFSLCTFLLFISGYVNFLPGTGALFSSLGVIIFSVIIVFSFVRMHTIMSINYNRLIEHQKKLNNTGSLTASLVHEVKNTMQIINGYSKLLGESILSKDEKRMNNMITEASVQLNNLLNSYTQYIKTKSVEFSIIDLNAIINSAIYLSREFTKHKEIEIVFQSKYKTIKTYANDTYLKQVFVNLIKNGAEAIKEGSELRKITISTDIQKDTILINFWDTGKGISKEKWEDIFNPFHSTKEDGLGLGLPFVKNIILEHRGEIKVVDSSSHGTNIQIILPQYSFSTIE
ncbi:MAG TPA: HAMP domain-containing sensor histidine kinase [Niallia sp.]|nr:HAMP domain-containing sensor histidine kinase [Niallia sp.]